MDKQLKLNEAKEIAEIAKSVLLKASFLLIYNTYRMVQITHNPSKCMPGLLIISDLTFKRLTLMGLITCTENTRIPVPTEKGKEAAEYLLSLEGKSYPENRYKDWF